MSFLLFFALIMVWCDGGSLAITIPVFPLTLSKIAIEQEFVHICIKSGMGLYDN